MGEMTADQRRILAAYKIALSMMRDSSPRKLLDLLNVLECRDLLRLERLEQIISGQPRITTTRVAPAMEVVTCEAELSAATRPIATCGAG